MSNVQRLAQRLTEGSGIQGAEMDLEHCIGHWTLDVGRGLKTAILLIDLS